MLTTSARLLRLLSLLQRRRHWSAAGLAARLEVGERTVRRDVDRLRELGYPVHASPGLGGGYQLGAGTTMPPVLLEDDEAVAMALALRVAAGSVAGMDEAALRLLARLDQMLPARLQSRVRALEPVMVTLPGDGARADVGALAVVAGACRDRARLRLGYVDRDGKESRRLLEPLHLVHTGYRWYLVAWDLARDDFRTFRMDRAREPEVEGTRFQPRALPEEVSAFVARAIRQAPHRYQLRVRLRGSATALAGRVPGWCGVLEPEGRRTCLLRIGASSVEALAAHLVMAGADFEILDAPPFLPELRAVIRRLHRQASAA